MTKLGHTKPCRECPWRRTSPPGYLGGHSPEFFADAVAEGVPLSCHLHDHGPDDPRTRYCAGSLIALKNACTLPRNREAAAAVGAVDRSPDVFGHASEFYRHHTGREYVSRMVRALTRKTG